MLDAGDHGREALVTHEPHDLPALLAKLAAAGAVQDVGLGLREVPLAHERLLDEVLDLLDRGGALLGHAGFDRGDEGLELVPGELGRRGGEGLLDGAADLGGVVFLRRAVSLDYLHRCSRCCGADGACAIN